MWIYVPDKLFELSGLTNHKNIMKWHHNTCQSNAFSKEKESGKQYYPNCKIKRIHKFHYTTEKMLKIEITQINFLKAGFHCIYRPCYLTARKQISTKNQGSYTKSIAHRKMQWDLRHHRPHKQEYFKNKNARKQIHIK